MPRIARVKTDTKTYHAMIRGVNKQIIFEEADDYKVFTKLLGRYGKECLLNMFAFCLMNNHVHIVLQETSESIAAFFRKLNTSYAMYFNQKYGRCGHLFQDRFKSEPINSDAQLMQTIRYVHRNPVKAGICQSPEQYVFSSYPEYIYKKASICDTKFIIDLFGSLESFVDFSEEESSYECMENETGKRSFISDEEAKRIILDVTHEAPSLYFQKLNKYQRDEELAMLKNMNISAKQISRLTGISPWIVRRAEAEDF